MARTALLLFTFAFAALADERTAAVDKIVAPLRDSNAPGCAIGVIQNGRFLYKTAFGLADLETRAPLSSATAFNVASMSKQFTAAALFFLVDNGKVHLTDPIRRFLPELPGYADAITVADLLHHTSGLRDFGPLLEIAGRAEESLDVAGSLKLLARQTALNFAPGAGYEYTNSDYLLLGAIVERVTGMTLAAYAEERLFGPLRMANTQFYGHFQKLRDRAAGYVERGSRYRKISQPMLMSGAGGLFTTIDDLLHWDDNFYNPVVGRRLVPELHVRARPAARWRTAALRVGVDPRPLRRSRCHQSSGQPAGLPLGDDPVPRAASHCRVPLQSRG